MWKGIRFVGPEQVFLARYPSLDAPPLRPVQLTPEEQQNLAGHAWVTRSELLALPERRPGDPRRRDRVPPPHLAPLPALTPSLAPVAALTSPLGAALTRPARS